MELAVGGGDSFHVDDGCCFAVAVVVGAVGGGDSFHVDDGCCFAVAVVVGVVGGGDSFHVDAGCCFAVAVVVGAVGGGDGGGYCVAGGAPYCGCYAELQVVGLEDRSDWPLG